MVFSTVFKAFVLLPFFLVSVEAEPKDFLRKVSSREIVNDLEASLADLLSGHASAAASKRLAAIESSIWKTFQSMPKNDMGRLAPPAVRYIVHGYFAREHGWQIKGLEPHGMQVNATATKVHNVHILQDKAPALVEGLLEARHENNGLGLTDVVAMVAVLEQLVFDESVTLLEAAYRLNSEPVTDHIEESTLHRILKSYLVLFGQGSKADLYDVHKHQAILAARPRDDIDHFERNAVMNFEYRNRHLVNPFVQRRYSFEAVAEIVADIAQRYGKWQDAECRDMKAHLVELDLEGTGRVPLGLLYAQPPSASYHFSESTEYLRKIGALDETTTTPKVLIANYITGPSNCIASSSYYSVCCLNNCDSIMDEIEHSILAPAAAPERLLAAIRNISSASLAPGLLGKLQRIAERHGGDVPLHGRLFAQFLHFAFPHECNFPSILENAAALATGQWKQAEYSSSEEERMKQVLSVDAAALTSSDVNVEELWSDHEVLPAHGATEAKLCSGTAAAVVRGAVQLAAVVLGLRSIYAAWNAASSASDGKGKKDHKKDDDLILGFSV